MKHEIILSGIPLGTVQKIFAGVTGSSRYKTLMALERLFKAEQDRVEDYYTFPDECMGTGEN